MKSHQEKMKCVDPRNAKVPPRLLAIVTLWLTASATLLAQQVTPNIVLQNNNFDSDWAVQVKWANGVGDNLTCLSPNYFVTIYRNGAPYQFNGTDLTLGNGQHLQLDNVGINKTYQWSMKYEVRGLLSCVKWKLSQNLSITTKPLKKPGTFAATDSTSVAALENKITLTWTKGTHAPDGVHSYRIYRDGNFSTPIQQLPGTARSWSDTDVHPGEKHSYSIHTYVNHATWGVHSSDTVTVQGSTLPKITATDGEFFGRVEIRWPAMNAAAKSLKIFRDGVEIHSRTDMALTRVLDDDNRIPGLNYTYTIVPYLNTNFTTPFSTLTDVGYARRNGRIRGSVKAPFGGPVQGATVFAERLTTVAQGGANPIVYSATTDAQGLFEIRDIYYYTEATFRVHAEKGDHGFNPAAYESIVLDESAPVYVLPSPSFVDTSSFTIEGRVVQKFAGEEAAVEGVEILVNDLFKGTKTDEEGKYSLTVEEIGEYTIKPRYVNHTFSPASKTLVIENDLTEVLFEDVEKDTLSGYFLGGCEIYIGRATLRVFNTEDPTAAFDTIIVTNEGSGFYRLILPSREYMVEVVAFSPDDAGSPTEEEVLDFFGLSEVDLTEHSIQKNYVYRKPPEIEVIGFPAAGCDPFDVPIVEQIARYPLEIRVSESFGELSCLTSSGYIVIYDEVKDGFDGPDTLMLEGGIARYDLLPGEPNILSGGNHPYQKKIAFHANVDGQTNDVEQYTLVEGNKPREQTFTTISPEVPFLILRDPPGDESYSYLSANTKFSSDLQLFAQYESSLNVWGEVKLGSEMDIGIGVETPLKFWGKIKSSLEVGAKLKSQVEFGLEFSTENKFSTSDNQEITGSDGDVFVGSAMNMIYALTDVVDFNEQSCTVDLSQEIIMATDGFATTFMYTESHIEDVLIPQLESIKRLYEEKGSDSADVYQNQIDVWHQTLEGNNQLKEDAFFLENKSFSAGAGFESSAKITASTKFSLEYSMFIESTVATEAGLEIGGSGASLGADMKCRLEIGGSASLGAAYEKTVGYALNDDDLGDYFSVDVKADLKYGTPVFTLVSGRSSCPWEPGTQPREGVRLTVDKAVQHDIEQNVAAAFVLNLGNTSQSDEDQTYHLVFLQESNPEGAVLTLGGSQVQGGIPTPYSIPNGSSLNATVTVSRGPQSNAYQDLKFVLRSACDGSIADTVSFSVFFKSNCSAIAIVEPFANWLINDSDDSKLMVKIGNYDKAKLSTVILQYKNVNASVWESSVVMESSELATSVTDLEWDVAALEDGDYEIRVKVICGDNASEYSFSEQLPGTIDRSAPSLFGVPQPTDGTFSTGDEISATFDESLNCFNISEDNVILKNKNSGVVYEVGVGCAGNKILIVPLTEESFTNQVIEVTLVNIEDNAGNVRSTPVIWEFDIDDADFSIGPQTDSDGDGHIDADDNCAFTSNANQEDRDGDGIGDVCDSDLDGDGVANTMDNCPYFANANQADENENGVGDVCEANGDGDQDGVINDEDNCPLFANGDQQDMDSDGIGDLCDDDRDGDGVLNALDNCPSTPNPDQADDDGDGEGDACHVVTGIVRELESSRVIEVYPNPASHEINVRVELDAPARVVVSILDVNSKRLQLVWDEFLPAGQHHRRLNVSDLSNGLYILHVNKSGNIQVKKLIIRK